MVRLVPPFLRNFIGSAEDSKRATSTPADKTDSAHENADKSDEFDIKSYSSDETLDTIKNEQLEDMEITSNIATIASIDWGPPKLNFGILDELGQSGRYLFDRIRGNKTTFENPDDLTKNIKNLPKVYESDFSVYLNQIDEIYSEYSGFNTFEDDNNSNKEKENEEKSLDNNIDNVSREYFEDDYDVHTNSILNKELDSIPESIEFLESQLMLINNQLRELVGTHLKHVSESFVCIEDLKNSFTNVNLQITNVRDIFNNLKGIYNSPVQYKHFKSYKSKQGFYENNIISNDNSNSGNNKTNNNEENYDFSTLKTSKSLDSQYTGDNETYTLHEILIFKKKIIDFLGHLKILRGVSCIPEYIQGIVEINNMALARVFAACSLEYFQTHLSKYVLTNSVTLVVKDTIGNMERVAEAKFIDLTFFALSECYSIQDINEYEKSLKATLEKIEPVLVVLTISGLVDDILTTLETTNITPVDFGTKTKINMETVQKHLDQLLIGFKHSNIFLINMFHSIICVYLFHTNGEYMPNSTKSSEIVKKMILKIQENFSNEINRDYQKITEITHLLKNELSLPTSCKPELCFDYYQNVEIINNSGVSLDSFEESFVDKRKDIRKKLEDKKQGKNIDSKEKNEENVLDNYDSEYFVDKGTQMSTQTSLESVLDDLIRYYQKFYRIVENSLLKSLLSLLSNSNLDLNVSVGDLFIDIETTMLNMKLVEKMYKKSIERCVEYLKITNKLVINVLLTQFNNHSLKTKIVKQFVDNLIIFNKETNLSECRENKDDQEKEKELGKENKDNKEEDKLELEEDQKLNNKRLENYKMDKIEKFKKELNNLNSMSNMMDVFYNFVSTKSKKNVEILFEQSLVKIHENLNQENWERFEKVKLENKDYNLVESSVKLNEHLNVYFGISEKFFFMANTTVSKSINLFAYFNTLIENELEKNLCVKKLCLIIQTLDFFSTLIPIKIRNVSKFSKLSISSSSESESKTSFSTSLTSSSSESYSDDNKENYDLLVVLGSNAENCVLEAKLLRKKSSDLLADFIFSQIKMHLINWIFKYTDLQDNSQIEDTSNDVNMICKTISDLYYECSEMFVLEDLKIIFSNSFDKLLNLVKKQNVDLSQFHSFSDECTKIITNLEHLKDIKLEILSFANNLTI